VPATWVAAGETAGTTTAGSSSLAFLAIFSGTTRCVCTDGKVARSTAATGARPSVSLRGGGWSASAICTARGSAGTL
jgi:hypothetical protein